MAREKRTLTEKWIVSSGITALNPSHSRDTGRQSVVIYTWQVTVWFMPHGDMADGDTTDQSSETSLEERIAALEEHNAELEREKEQIKSQLDQQQDGGLPNVTRRQTLGGLLGGGALLGAAGSASAQSGEGDDPFGDDEEDDEGEEREEDEEDGGEFQTATVEKLIVGDNITSKPDADLASDHEEYNPHFPRLAEQSGPPAIQPHPDVSNPVLTGNDVTDIAARYVADPFIIYEDSIFHMFFEIFPEDGGPAVIGHATSVDGLQWNYNQVVLDVDDFEGDPHASFPYVFKWKDNWYMLPERAGQNIEIYTATSFPTDWKLVGRPLTMKETGDFFADAMPIYWEGTWYLIYGGRDPTALRLRYSDTLVEGDWKEHPAILENRAG
jgi:hypothetical protein